MVVRLLVALVVVASVGACSSGSPPKAGHSPVPDKALYAEIMKLPGVKQVSLGHKDSFGSSNSYSGMVEVSPKVDPRRVLDQTLAILRTGRAQADYGSVSVAVGSSPGVFPNDLGLVTQGDYAKRYGKQPGDGKPPASLPARQ